MSNIRHVNMLRRALLCSLPYAQFKLIVYVRKRKNLFLVPGSVRKSFSTPPRPGGSKRSEEAAWPCGGTVSVPASAATCPLEGRDGTGGGWTPGRAPAFPKPPRSPNPRVPQSPFASTSGLAPPPPSPKSAALPPLHLSPLLLENTGILKWRREEGAGGDVDCRGCACAGVRRRCKGPWFVCAGIFFSVCARLIPRAPHESLHERCPKSWEGLGRLWGRG